MYKIQIAAKDSTKPPLTYTYLVGAHTVGIITPSRKRYMFNIHEVTGRKENSRTGTNNGFADSRLHPDELVAFVLRMGLK
jgi:hypothetical protein